MRAGQESAGGAEKQAVNRGERRTSRLPAKNRDFVPQHDDLKFLKLLRLNTQHHDFQKPGKQPVAQRHEHEASYVAGYRPFYAPASSLPMALPRRPNGRSLLRADYAEKGEPRARRKVMAKDRRTDSLQIADGSVQRQREHGVCRIERLGMAGDPPADRRDSRQG